MKRCKLDELEGYQMHHKNISSLVWQLMNQQIEDHLTFSNAKDDTPPATRKVQKYSGSVYFTP